MAAFGRRVENGSGLVRVIVTGASGFVGGYLTAAIRAAGHEALEAGRAGRVRLDLTEPATVARALLEARADAVIHGAAIGDPRLCEADPAEARRVNVDGTRAVVDACAAAGVRLVFLSTEQVFDGTQAPYREDAAVNPQHEYGRNKVEGERLAAALSGRGVVARVSLVYGRSPNPARSASDQVIVALREGKRPRLFTDEIRTPVHVADVASTLAELATMDSPPRIVHIAGPDRMSRYDFGAALARQHGLDPGQIDGALQSSVISSPARPRDLSLDTTLARRILRSPPRHFASRLTDT